MSKKEDKCRFMIETKRSKYGFSNYLYFDNFMEANDVFNRMAANLVTKANVYYSIILFYKDDEYSNEFYWLKVVGKQEMEKDLFIISYVNERNDDYYEFNYTNYEFEIKRRYRLQWIKEGIYYEKNNNG